MKRFAAIGLVCGAGGIATAWPMWSGLAAITATTSHNSTLASEQADDTTAQGLCVYNFSKDGCDGLVKPGELEVLGGCSADCRTYRVTGAEYTTSLKTSGLGCGIPCESRCDEFEDGFLTVKLNYVITPNTCCPYRGSWTGDWTLRTSSGRVFVGTAHGTIGVGTNRESDCPVTDDACEKCADVEFTGDAWLIGLEGSFRGYEANTPTITRDELNFTTDATWKVGSQSVNPFAFPFDSYARFDGAYLDFCP